jgi:hypothetical protein
MKRKGLREEHRVKLLILKVQTLHWHCVRQRDKKRRQPRLPHSKKVAVLPTMNIIKGNWLGQVKSEVLAKKDAPGRVDGISLTKRYR